MLTRLVLLTGSVHDIKWRDVRVGHVLRVDDEELFPADLLCLYSALPDHACFIKTTNLDGESNLKIRRPVDLREAAPSEESDVMQIRASLECEPPNANLHKFQGRLLYNDGTAGAGICLAPPLRVSHAHSPKFVQHLRYTFAILWQDLMHGGLACNMIKSNLLQSAFCHM